MKKYFINIPVRKQMETTNMENKSNDIISENRIQTSIENPVNDIETEFVDIYKEMPLTEETTCGIWMFKGKRMQTLANKKILVLLFGLSGCCFSSTFAYFNGTITTMEKRFRISSKTTGIISVGNDITQLLASVVLNYYASKGHRPRWIASGLYCVAAFCFLNAMPHLLYGPGNDALQLTFEHGAEFDRNSNFTKNVISKQLCAPKEEEMCDLDEGSIVPPILWFIAQLISGIGGILYYSLGYSYMDDNIKKSKSPAFISLTYFMRTLGPAMGYAIVSICLKLYIAPDLTPIIDNTDPRWLGAWWIGWLVLGTLLIIFASMMAMFPKTLPRAAARKRIIELQNKDSENVQCNETSIKDMMETVKRLLYNSVYNYNQLASIFYVFGYIPFWIYLPKYIEIQYRKSASVASFVTGFVGLVFAAIGILTAGIIVQKFKPKARYMAFWNMIIDLISLFGILSYSFLGCVPVDEQIPIFDNGKLKTDTDCNMGCKCDYVKFSPVCSVDFSQTFISACHAGCTEQTHLSNGTIIYNNCLCINQTIKINGNNTDYFSNGSAISGPCPVDCQYQFYCFVFIICILKLFGSMSRVTNFLVSVRCVEERDKTVSLGISLTMISLFALIPSPIFFGYIMDSACLIWGKTCVGTGNCWFYNSALLRNRIVFTSLVFMVIGVFFDVAIWWNVKDLNMFDDGLETVKNNEKMKCNDKNDSDNCKNYESEVCK